MSDQVAHRDQELARRGLMFVLSSPSGAGKTTLSRGLLAADPNIAMSISLTTRSPRPGEVDGSDYHFVDKQAFFSMRESGDLLESAEVFDNYYATPKKPVMAALEAGQDILFDIDWQGAQQLRAMMPHDVVSVFILPPDAETLEQRLKTRAQDSDDVVARRMAKAANEISHWAEYDYVLVNRHLDKSQDTLAAILTAERNRRERLVGLRDSVGALLHDLDQSTDQALR